MFVFVCAGRGLIQGVPRPVFCPRAMVDRRPYLRMSGLHGPRPQIGTRTDSPMWSSLSSKWVGPHCLMPYLWRAAVQSFLMNQSMDRLRCGVFRDFSATGRPCAKRVSDLTNDYGINRLRIRARNRSEEWTPETEIDHLALRGIATDGKSECGGLGICRRALDL